MTFSAALWLSRKFTAALRLEVKKFGLAAYNGGLGVYYFAE